VSGLLRGRGAQVALIVGLVGLLGTQAAPALCADEPPSLLAPALPRAMTRVRGTVRPFLSVFGRGGGTVADLAVDHYFRAPFRLSVEVAPLALAADGQGSGAIGHFRLAGAYAGDFIELGAAAGSRVQHYGGAGISLAAFLRLGALDGLNLTVINGYVWKRNRYTGRPTLGLASGNATFQVPLSPRFALFTEAAFSTDHWLYATAGLRHRLTGEGRGGSWYLSGAFGLAWVVDRPDCPYPDTGWCRDAAWAAGPTIALGLERRF
jgi:hypothetical protein